MCKCVFLSIYSAWFLFGFLTMKVSVFQHSGKKSLSLSLEMLFFFHFFLYKLCLKLFLKLSLHICCLPFNCHSLSFFPLFHIFHLFVSYCYILGLIFPPDSSFMCFLFVCPFFFFFLLLVEFPIIPVIIFFIFRMSSCYFSSQLVSFENFWLL